MKPTTLILLFLSITSLTFAQGKLDRAKESLKSSTSKDSYSSSDDSELGSAAGGFFADMFGNIFAFAFIGNLEPKNFYPYPYAADRIGEYGYPESNPAGKKSKFVISNTMAFQVSTFANDLRLNYRFIPILGLEANHLHFFDELDEGSELSISSMMLNFYRIRERNVTGYWGLGASYVGSDVNTMGFAYNVGMDIYIAKPISLNLYWKQRFINETSINEIRVYPKYHIKKLAVYGGFIHYKIGAEGFPSAAAGIEYRF